MLSSWCNVSLPQVDGEFTASQKMEGGFALSEGEANDVANLARLIGWVTPPLPGFVRKDFKCWLTDGFKELRWEIFDVQVKE